MHGDFLPSCPLLQEMCSSVVARGQPLPGCPLLAYAAAHYSVYCVSPACVLLSTTKASTLPVASPPPSAACSTNMLNCSWVVAHHPHLFFCLVPNNQELHHQIVLYQNHESQQQGQAKVYKNSKKGEQLAAIFPAIKDGEAERGAAGVAFLTLVLPHLLPGLHPPDIHPHCADH